VSDQFTPYETGLTKLLEQLEKEHPLYTNALVFQQRLTEDIATARTHGDTEALRHQRSRTIYELNRLAQDTLNVSFNDLCPGLPPSPPSPVEAYLDAVRDYCANLPYLTLHGIRLPKTLGEVYVPLRLSPPGRRSEPVSIAEVMQHREHTHVLILGGPGTGKSTLLRQLAECAWDAPECIGLDAPHLPILVPLQRLVATDGSLEDRLSRALTAELALMHKLPDGFFADWPAQTGKAWLVLLDGLDEVPAGERPRLVQWLKGVLRHIGQHRVVISSRPTGYTPGELDDRQFGRYGPMPFTPEQTSEFVHKWLGDKADGFLEGLWRVGAGDLRSTPLLLTIAARVYLEKDSLPARRSVLYGQCVDTWLDEAGQRGLEAELGERVCKVAKFALARLALAMTERPGEVSETALNKVAAAYLRDALRLSADEAAVDGARFVRVMARRSGVFVRPSDLYGFVHPTFREYLAAFALVRAWNYDPSQAATFLGDRWQDDVWYEVLLFALSLLSDHEADVSDLLEPLLRQDWAGVRFAGQALAEGVRVTQELCDRIVDRLLESARAEPWDLRALSILGRLRGNERAVDGLLALAQDGTTPGNLRLEASQSLGRLNRVDEAVSVLLDLPDLLLSGDDSYLDDEFNWTIKTLARWGHLREAAPKVLAMACDEGVQYSYDLYGMDEEAWWALDVLGAGDETARALQAVGLDEAEDAEVRLLTVVSLKRLGWDDEAVAILSALAHDAAIDAEIRVQAAEMMAWWLEEHEVMLADLNSVCDTALEAKVRLWAACRLRELICPAEVDWEDEVLAVVADESASVQARVESARELEQPGRVDDAMLAYLTLVCDTTLEDDVRLEAADALSRLSHEGQFPEREAETASILSALGSNAAVDPTVRLLAAQSLGTLGQVDQSVSILSVLVNSAAIDAWVHEEVVSALHDMGYDENGVELPAPTTRWL
jgi:uncharacterized protein (UPF0147 family)